MTKMPKTMTIEMRGDVTVCLSYGTPVAAFVPGQGYVKTDRRYSVTTSKHANQFCRNGGSDGRTIDHDAFIQAINGSGDGPFCDACQQHTPCSCDDMINDEGGAL
jgi:hypothetical protein